MNSKSVYKVPDGKLLKITLDYNEENNTINTVKITGDFFVYPEEAIEKMEDELKNIIIEKNALIGRINRFIKDNNIEFIGLNAEGLATGIMMCVG